MIFFCLKFQLRSLFLSEKLQCVKIQLPKGAIGPLGSTVVGPVNYK